MTSEDDLKMLMIDGLRGDRRAHEELLRAIAPILTAYFRRRCGSGGLEPEDLMQETLIAIHEKRATFDASRPFTVWMFAIARYKLIDAYRKLKRSPPTEELSDILAVEGFESAVSARMDVDRLLGFLPSKQSEALRKTKITGLSVAEHAETSGLSESDVKISVHRGLKGLAARLRGEN